MLKCLKNCFNMLSSRFNRLKKYVCRKQKVNLKESQQNVSVSSNAQVSDVQAFGIPFTETISQIQRLKAEVHTKITDLEMKLKLEEIERVSLESTLKKEREISHELTERIASLTKLNESLTKRSEEQIKSVLDALALKDARLNALDKDCQQLRKEKESFNDRIRVFINDISLTHNVENTEEFVKRPNEVGVDMFRGFDENSVAKRRRTDDSSDPLNEVKITDAIRDLQPGPTMNNAASESIGEIENPILEKRRDFRKNIKKVMDFEKLTPETKLAYQQEKERRKQYVKRLQKYNDTYGTLPGEINKCGKLVLDFDLNTKQELLVVDERLSRKLKPHQFEGVKFMWDACFESIEKLQSSDGSGCILGHCMGLGKTLQVIALVHTLLTNRIKTNVGRVLIICPVNVILNWVAEFQVWLEDFPKKKNVKIIELASSSLSKRLTLVKSWQEKGGVLIVGYSMLQKMNRDIWQEVLVNPGADLVVCDEGHLLKNPTSQLSLAIGKIRTLRRIILTGTPLQNNLKEYFTMVEFVKPRLLGTEMEFNNRFVGPILNGQCINSTEEDIMLMKHRACILHELLDGCVQRRDYSVLAQFLPPKQEYVLFIRLTEVQMDLYKLYMTKIVKRNAVADLPSLRMVCNHPHVLDDFEDRRREREQSKARNNVVPSQKNELESELLTRHNEFDENADDHKWWKPLCIGNELKLSGKMSILASILAECEARDEKLLVFSGCLSTLNVIEHFLAKSDQFTGTWIRNVDYLRLDGTQNVEKRKANRRARLYLISTKAGGLGINLMAANRVVIFDASFDANDIQSIFRTYRIGQEKECYVYRFVALGTMEEKIYDRQVSKLSIAKRVIDEHQINKHFKEDDLDPPKNQALSVMSKDSLLNELLRKHRDVIFKYLDHDSLLENLTNETLTEQEIGDAWEEFENDNAHD